MGYRGLEDLFQGISMLGRSLQQIRSQKEEEELRRLKNYYGDNIEAFRQDALKDEKLGKQYRKFVGDPNNTLPEDPKAALMREQDRMVQMQAEQIQDPVQRQKFLAAWQHKRMGLGADVSKSLLEGMFPAAAEPISPEKMADLKLRYMNQNVGPQEVLAEGFKALMGQPSAKYSGLYQQSSPEAQKMIESGPYGDINKWSPGVPNVKSTKQFEAEESARKEAESLRRFEIGQVNYKERTDAINRRLNDASARAWKGLSTQEQRLAVTGLKSEMDRQRNPINTAIENARAEKKRAEDALNKIRLANSGRMRGKDWAKQPANAELARMVQGLEERINQANETMSSKSKELKKLESWYNGQIKEVDPNYRVYTTDEEDDAPVDTFMENS